MFFLHLCSCLLTLDQYERFQDTNPGIDESVHGYEGEISVSAGTYAQRPFQEDFLQACKEIGIPETVDVQDLRTSNAVGVCSYFPFTQLFTGATI